MEKLSPKWLKKFLAILLPIALFASLSMQIFADFSGDGTANPYDLFPDYTFRDITISTFNSTGGTDSIDNISFLPEPIFGNGTLNTLVSRGTYTNSGAYFRYTNSITRSSLLENSYYNVTQKLSFDEPLFNTLTEFNFAFSVPLLYVSNDYGETTVTFDTKFGNVAETVTITEMTVYYETVQFITDVVENDNKFTIITRSQNLPALQDYEPDEMLTFPYTFDIREWVTSGTEFITNLKVIFRCERNPDITTANDIFTFSVRQKYFDGYPKQFPSFESQFDTQVETQVNEIVYMDKIPFAEVITNSFSDFVDIEVFGAFSISNLFWAVIGVGLVIIFIKLFAGG